MSDRYQSLPDPESPGIIAVAPTLFEVFENAAYGVFDTAYDLTGVASPYSRPVVAAGDRWEELLWAWLDELLAMSRVEGIVPSYFTVDRLEEGGVQGSAAGLPSGEVAVRPVEVTRIKRAGLSVIEVPEGWWCRVMLDTTRRRPTLT